MRRAGPQSQSQIASGLGWKAVASRSLLRPESPVSTTARGSFLPRSIWKNAAPSRPDITKLYVIGSDCQEKTSWKLSRPGGAEELNKFDLRPALSRHSFVEQGQWEEEGERGGRAEERFS